MVKPKAWVRETPIYRPRSYRGVVARLDMNESPNPPPDHVRRAVEREASRLNRYPDQEMEEELLSALAGYAEVGEDELLPAAGSDMVIRAVFDAFVDRGDRVCFPRYGFSMYSIYSRLTDARPVLLDMAPREGEWMLSHTLDAGGLGGCRVVFIDRPNNPTGGRLADAGEIRRLAEELDAMVVVDEAYYEYYGETLKSLALERENVVLARTLSKAFGLAALRLGYAIARPETLDVLRRTLPPFPITRVTAAAAVAALQDPVYVYEHVRQVDELKQMVYNRVSRMGVTAYRSRANFILMDTRVEGVEARLRDRGIAVRGVPLGASWLRVTMGTPGEVELFLQALGEVLGG